MSRSAELARFVGVGGERGHARSGYFLIQQQARIGGQVSRPGLGHYVFSLCVTQRFAALRSILVTMPAKHQSGGDGEAELLGKRLSLLVH